MFSKNLTNVFRSSNICHLRSHCAILDSVGREASAPDAG